ncbi:MAG: tetratricopeptide repeat protein, partial [Bacteroidales bacterium]|nr:tetratricopeptide repeat protein [Bacteroidales bacterium]
NAVQKGLTDLAEGYFVEAGSTAYSLAANYQLGLIMEGRERFVEAALLFAAADSSASAMAHLAACRVETSDWDEAKTAAEKAVELGGDPDVEASAMATLALYYCHMKNYTNAAHWAKQATAKAPNSPRPWNVAGIVSYSKGNDSEAISHFRKALQVDPDNRDAYFNLGTMYCLRNNYESAVNTLRKGLQRHRQSLKLYHCLGWAYTLRGDKQKAIQCYQTVIELDSHYVDAYNRIGDIYFSQGDYERAISMYRQATRVAPRSAEGYKLMGHAYAEKGDYPAAIRNYQRATEMDKNDSQTYLLIADLYSKQGNQKREQANYKRAAKLGNTEAQAWCVKRGIKW